MHIYLKINPTNYNVAFSQFSVYGTYCIYLLNRPDLCFSFSLLIVKYIWEIIIYIKLNIADFIYIYICSVSLILSSSFLYLSFSYHRWVICSIEWKWFIEALQLWSLSRSLSEKPKAFHLLPRTQELLDFLISIHFPDSSSLCSIVCVGVVLQK